MENSTNNFKESIELSWTLIDNVLGGKKRLTRGLLRKLNELNELNEENLTGLTNRASRFSNSILILKNTIEQAMLPNEETNNKDDQDASFVECSEPTLFLQQISQKEKNTIKQAMTDEKTNNRGDQCLELTLSPYRILQKRKNNAIEQVVELMVDKEKNNGNDRDASIIEYSKPPLHLHQLLQQEKNDIKQAMLPDEETNASVIECSEPILPLQLLEKKNNTIKQATLLDEEKNSKNDEQDASIIERSKPSLPLHQLSQKEKNNIEQAMKVNEKNAFIIECSESTLPLHQLSQEEKNNAIKQAVMVDEETNSKDASIIDCSEPTLPLQQISQKQKNNSQQAMVVEEETHSRGDQNASIIEYSKSLQQKPCLFVEEVITIACSTSQKQQIQSKNPKKKKHKKKLSVILINNDSSDGHSIDVQKSSIHESIQSSSNGENIAPQMEDDVIELWSNLNTNKKKKNTQKHEYNNGNKKALFVIDTKPDLKNLNCLNTKPVKKKQKLYHESDKAALTKQHNSIYLDIESTKTQSQKYKKEKKKKKRCSTLNEASSSIGNLTSNLASTSTSDSTSSSNRLREIVVDGSNVARAFTYNEGFGERGIQLVVDYFISRGHVVKVFLPQYIRNKKYKFLERMYKKGVVVFTPSRKVLGRKITPYDDRFILEYATLRDGIVVSADQFRDLYNERPDWRNTILNRLLTPTFVGDCVMFPDDPLGRFGPSLYTFLRH